MNTPLVTLCVPCYNSSSTLEESLHSICGQDYPNLLVKVFDNCSTDNSKDIVKKLMLQYPFLELIENELNIGGEGNFTRCLQSGEGEYTGVFHTDDIYLPHMVKTQVELLERNREAVAVAVHAKNIDSKGKIIGERFIPYSLRKNDHTLIDRENLLSLVFNYGNFITCPSVLARTAIYRDKIAKWNGEDFKTSADLDVWLRLTEHGPLIFCKAPLMNYRVAEASYSYRLKKVRTHRHDLFLVLDHLRKDAEIAKRYQAEYDFLEMKDRALINYNLLKSNQSQPYRTFNLLKNLVIGLKDGWHLKFWLLSLAISIYAKAKGESAP